MPENEIMLLNLIREHDDPEKAIEIAIDVIIGFLKQLESFE
jgi:hypothetical protein